MHKRPHGRNTLVEGDPLSAGTGKSATSGCAAGVTDARVPSQAEGVL